MKRPRICEKVVNPRKGSESAKRPQILEKGLKSVKKTLFKLPVCSPFALFPFVPPNSIHIATKGLHRSPPRAKNFGAGSKEGPIGGISIPGCMVPTTCGTGSGKDQGSSGSRGEGKGAKRE